MEITQEITDLENQIKLFKDGRQTYIALHEEHIKRLDIQIEAMENKLRELKGEPQPAETSGLGIYSIEGVQNLDDPADERKGEE